MADTLRQTTLTVLGSIGYVAFLGAAAAKVAGYPVTWELIGVILFTSSAMLGVDFGLDIIPAWADRNQNQNQNQNHDRNTQPQPDQSNEETNK